MYDHLIVGSGIVGLATAYALKTMEPSSKILVLDKESSPAVHQTGHNSGVIHAGIYYAPGSMKAELCYKGLSETKAFCIAHNVKYEQCGKLIVATDDIELRRIEELESRAKLNGVDVERISNTKLRAIEPNVAGREALLSPETAIVDYRVVANRMLEYLKATGVDFRFSSEVKVIEESAACVKVRTNFEAYNCLNLVACGGLQSDRLAKAAGLDIDFKIVPFRGEYFKLPSVKNNIVQHLIYPAPNPELPFLGVHLTRMIDGSVTVGPNAVIGFSREGYEKWSFSYDDVKDYLGYSGFWKLINKYKTSALREFQSSLFKSTYLKECQKYCPSLRISDLLPYRAGIRAQAVLFDGTPVHDFLFKQTKRMLHVCNAPSPAATSALPIGRFIADKCMQS